MQIESTSRGFSHAGAKRSRRYGSKSASDSGDKEEVSVMWNFQVSKTYG
jgi:hypothetical protein